MTELDLLDELGARLAVLGVATGAVRPTFVLRDGGHGPRDTTQAIFLAADGRPLAVARIARGATGRRALRAERVKLDVLGKALLPRAPGSLPVPLDLVESGELTVLLESHLPGRRLKDLDPRHVERRPDLVSRVVDWLIELALASARVAPGSPGGRVADLVEASIESYVSGFDRSTAEDRFLETLPSRLDQTGGGALALVIGHGDFSDANVLVEDVRIGVVDWDEPLDRVPPGADLFHLLASLGATRHGLGERKGFERGFVEGFLAPSPTSDRNRAAWTRTRETLGVPAAATLPLFGLSWVLAANAKLAYLRESVGPTSDLHARAITSPQCSYPITFFEHGRCLNLALTAEHSAELAL